MTPRKPVSSTSWTSRDKFEVRRDTTAVLNHFPAPSIYCGRLGSGQYNLFIFLCKWCDFCFSRFLCVSFYEKNVVQTALQLPWSGQQDKGCLSFDNTDSHLLVLELIVPMAGKNSVYFPNPSHEAFRVPRCRRQFNVCCSPRPMSKVIYGLMMLVGLDLFIRGGPGLLSPPNWVTEAKGVDGLSEQWPEGGNSTVCNRVT